MNMTMSFGEALERCKKGAKISRLGWNGKGQYVELATRISYVDAQGETINAGHKAIGNNALAFVGTSGVQLGWLASQADMLAEDWVLTDESEGKDIASVYQQASYDVVDDVIDDISLGLMKLKVSLIQLKIAQANKEAVLRAKIDQAKSECCCDRCMP